MIGVPIMNMNEREQIMNKLEWLIPCLIFVNFIILILVFHYEKRKNKDLKEDIAIIVRKFKHELKETMKRRDGMK